MGGGGGGGGAGGQAGGGVLRGPNNSAKIKISKNYVLFLLARLILTSKRCLESLEMTFPEPPDCLLSNHYFVHRFSKICPIFINFFGDLVYTLKTSQTVHIHT